MRTRFHKYHALGNAYLVVPPIDGEGMPRTEDIVRWCDPRFGIGGDGVLVGPLPSTRADFRLAIFNPDGSEAEKSGNGLRIFARHLFDDGRASLAPFTLETRGGVVEAEVREGGAIVRVDMGTARFLRSLEALRERIEIEDEPIEFVRVDLGNPHCVVPTANPDEALARRLGPLLERHALFPARTNVQFVAVRGPHDLDVQVWERGAGYTLASGSSSCAAAATMVALGECEREVTVHLAGGDLAVGVRADFSVTQTGPVRFIASGEMEVEAT